MSVDIYVCQACEQQAAREIRVGRSGPTKGVRLVVRPRMPGPSEPSAATCEYCAAAIVMPDLERQLADANRRLDEAHAEIKTVRAQLAERESISADLRSACADYKTVIEDLRAEIRRLNVDGQRATARWAEAHKPAILGEGHCDPKCAAHPPHVIKPLFGRPGTARVRIAVLVGPNRLVVRAGREAEDLRAACSASDHVVFVEADVPLPPEPATVKGRVAP